MVNAKHLTNDESRSQRPKGAAKRFALYLLLVSFLSFLTLWGALESSNTALMDMRFRLLEHKASNTLVVVEIDPRSLREEERWPWPRDRYANAVLNLQNAGAKLIAFDVDFSSLSDQAGDDAFAQALARRPGEVVLPVFWQWSSRSSTGGEMIKTPPHEKFLNDVAVASVTLTTEENGVVRHGWRGVDDEGVYRASIASVLAGASPTDHGTFLIDYSIDPNQIKRVSFHDVANGDFPADMFRGKNIIIGATALELGDEFAAPIYGVLPGVIFHAMSYESIVADRTLTRLHPVLPLCFGAALLIWLSLRSHYWSWKKVAAVHVAILVVTFCVPIVVQAYSSISIDVATIFAGQILGFIYVISMRLHEYARQVIRQRAATAHYQALTSLVVRDNTDGIVVLDEAGRIELCNDQARTLLGVGSSLKVGVSIRDLVPDFPLLTIDVTDQEVSESPPLSGSITQREYVANKDKGVVLDVVASRSLSRSDAASNEKYGKVVAYTLRDISARKRTEAAEREAKDAAIAANKIKSQLISNMSHELRTPLNGVIGFADILQKESYGPLGVPEYREYSESIYLCGKRLLAVVNDMLHIAKLDSGDYELCKSEVTVSDLIDNAVCQFERRAETEKKSLSVDIQPRLPTVDADVSVTKEIITHLLANAFKYTKEGGKIHVRAKLDMSNLVIEVEDDGCGIDTAILPQITDAFFQADAELNRKYEGAGLGLYVVSRFVELHHGSMVFESAPGSGFLARIVFKNAIASRENVIAAA